MKQVIYPKYAGWIVVYAVLFLSFGVSIGELLNIMGESTAIELKKSGIPVRIIYLENDKVDSGINLMTTLLLEVALIGKLIGINPFNQPAVEKVKLRIKKILNKK